MTPRPFASIKAQVRLRTRCWRRPSFTDAGDTLTYSVITGPIHASVFTFDSDGTFNYTPTLNYNGPDSFTFQASDGANASNISTMSITVNAVNDGPVNTVPGPQTTAEDTSKVFSSVTPTRSASPTSISARARPGSTSA